MEAEADFYQKTFLLIKDTKIESFVGPVCLERTLQGLDLFPNDIDFILLFRRYQRIMFLNFSNLPGIKILLVFTLTGFSQRATCLKGASQDKKFWVKLRNIPDASSQINV